MDKILEELNKRVEFLEHQHKTCDMQEVKISIFVVLEEAIKWRDRIKEELSK